LGGPAPTCLCRTRQVCVHSSKHGYCVCVCVHMPREQTEVEGAQPQQQQKERAVLNNSCSSGSSGNAPQQNEQADHCPSAVACLLCAAVCCRARVRDSINPKELPILHQQQHLPWCVRLGTAHKALAAKRVLGRVDANLLHARVIGGRTLCVVYACVLHCMESTTKSQMWQ
jgi:hypothetical protein